MSAPGRKRLERSPSRSRRVEASTHTRTQKHTHNNRSLVTPRVAGDVSKHGLGGAPGVGVLIGVRVPVRGWSALAQHATRNAVRKAALALVVRGLNFFSESQWLQLSSILRYLTPRSP